MTVNATGQETPPMNMRITVACLVAFSTGIVPALCLAMADEGPDSDDAVIEVAKTVILNVPFDHDAPITIETTNGLKKVIFPRKANRSVHASSPAQFAATVFVDPTTWSVVPNPGLPTLSDEQAIFIATNAVPIPLRSVQNSSGGSCFERDSSHFAGHEP